MLASPKATSASSLVTTPARSGKAQSSSSITTPCERSSAGVISRAAGYRLVRPEQLPAGDPEEQAVADLTGSAGDGHSNR